MPLFYLKLTFWRGRNIIIPTGKAGSPGRGSLVVGLEVLWDTSKWKPYFFFFVGGGSRNFLGEAEKALKEDLMYCLKRVPKGNLNALKNKLSDFGFSLSLVAVFGNRHSKFPSTYTGWFTAATLSIRHVVISGAVGYAGKAVIGSFALGITTSVLSFGLSQTYYWQISKDTKISDIVGPLKNTISNKLAWLQFFTFLLI